jgi:hypothetical protein
VLTSEHFKGHQLILHFSNVIIRAKIGLEFLDKFFPVIKPGWLLIESSRESEFKLRVSMGYGLPRFLHRLPISVPIVI